MAMRLIWVGKCPVVKSVYFNVCSSCDAIIIANKDAIQSNPTFALFNKENVRYDELISKIGEKSCLFEQEKQK